MHALFCILEPVTTKIFELSQSHDVYIVCVGYYPPSGHGVHLDKHTIQKVAKLGAAFDLDFYYVDDYGHDLDCISQP